jgi:hypothetical protein
MDFITSLPSSKGYDVIWVVIDYLTKMRYFAHCSTIIDAEGLADLFLLNIFYLYGLLDTIVSD